jgi:hypothetical protein
VSVMPHLIESGFFLFYVGIAAAMLALAARVLDWGRGRFLSRRPWRIAYLSFVGVLNLLVIGFVAADIHVEEEITASGVGG